jgi:hypothetical protein
MYFQFSFDFILDRLFTFHTRYRLEVLLEGQSTIHLFGHPTFLKK